MKKTFYAVGLFVIAAAVSGFSQKYPALRESDPGVLKGWMTRYWDACKPHCGRIHKSTPLFGACKTCDINNNEIPLYDHGDNNACEKREDQRPWAYTCWDQIPFRDPDDPNLAYAFGATPGTNGDQCGKCFQLQFNGGEGGTGGTGDSKHNHRALIGKTLIMMSSNIGHDVDPTSSQFDIMVPGGGVGQFDALSSQMGVRPEELGHGFGGFLGACQNEIASDPRYGWNAINTEQILTLFPECLREKCKLFDKPGLELLLEGCNFYADWFMAANNPAFIWKELDKCPDVLLHRFVEGSGGSNPTPMNGGNPPVPGTIISINPHPTQDGGWVGLEHGQSETYQIRNVPKDGEYKLSFGIAAENVNMEIAINGTSVGSILMPNGTPGGNSKIDSVFFDTPVDLKAGNNTITLRCPNAKSHITYIRLVEIMPFISVKHSTARTAASAQQRVTLKTAPKGFTAILPKNHTFESYSLIDLRGREIRSGKVKAGASELHFSNIRQGALFIRLKGKNGTTVLRTTTL